MIYSSLGAAGVFFEAWYSQNEKDRRKRKGNNRAMGEVSTETGECYKLNGARARCQATHLKSSHLTLASPSPPSIFLPLVWTECSPEAGTLILCQSSTTKLSVRRHFILVLGGMMQQFVPPHKTCNGGKKEAIKKERAKGEKNKQYFFFSQAIETRQGLSRHMLLSLIAWLTFLIVWACFEMVTWWKAVTSLLSLLQISHIPNEAAQPYELGMQLKYKWKIYMQLFSRQIYELMNNRLQHTAVSIRCIGYNLCMFLG